MGTDERTEVDAFWDLARFHAKLNAAPSYFGPTALESVPPPVWSFGTDAEQADALLRLVLDGTKTATASARWDFDREDEQLPQVGNLSILLDGAGHPRALLETTQVDVVPFDEVDAEHARLEGEGDLSLEGWRVAQERFFTETAAHGRGFRRDMPIVCERFRVVYAS